MSKRIDLSGLKKRADWKSWLVTSGHVSLVLAPVYAAAYLGFHWWWVFLWAWCGILMNGLLNLMHECAHYHTFRGRETSDLWGRWLVGPLLLSNFDDYRRRHWEHHKHLGVEGDTKDAYLLEISGGRFVVMLLRCLTFQQAAHKFGLQTKKSEAGCAEAQEGGGWSVRTIAVQAVFFATILWTAGILRHRVLWPSALITAAAAYAGVYMYGLATLTVFMANLRAIAEHQLEAGEATAHGRAALRNFRCGGLSRLVFGAYGFAEHATHHLEPGIPYYHLPASTVELAKEQDRLLPTRGYVGQLIALARGRDRTLRRVRAGKREVHT